MDAHLKALADVSLQLSTAEASLDEGAFTSAADALDEAAAGLQAVRDAWPEMSQAERSVVGRTAGPLRERLDASTARLPKRSALVEGTPEEDAEQDLDPEGPPA